MRTLISSSLAMIFYECTFVHCCVPYSICYQIKYSASAILPLAFGGKLQHYSKWRYTLHFLFQTVYIILLKRSMEVNSRGESRDDADAKDKQPKATYKRKNRSISPPFHKRETKSRRSRSFSPRSMWTDEGVFTDYRQLTQVSVFSGWTYDVTFHCFRRLTTSRSSALSTPLSATLSSTRVRNALLTRPRSLSS